jgi:hypothetical protein
VKDMAEKTTKKANEEEENRVYDSNVNYFGCGKEFDFED